MTQTRNATRNARRVTLRRLNRVEYNNTIRDLVGVDFRPASDFPADDLGYSFDDIGDVALIPPLLLEKYRIAAETILEQAIVNEGTPKPTRTRLGGLLASTYASGERRGEGQYLHSIGSFRAESYFDEGDYTFRVAAYAQQVGDVPARAVFRLNGVDIREFDVKGTLSHPTTIEAKVQLKPGTTRVALTFLNPFTDTRARPRERDGNRRLLFLRDIEVYGPYNAPKRVLPESHRRIMDHAPGASPREAAREIVARFATLAFRRPVKEAEVESLLKLYDRSEKDGDRFEDRVRLALEGVLVSPNFLYRFELDQPGAK